jgi:hypothetical protein
MPPVFRASCRLRRNRPIPPSASHPPISDLSTEAINSRYQPVWRIRHSTKPLLLVFHLIASGGLVAWGPPIAN